MAYVHASNKYTSNNNKNNNKNSTKSTRLSQLAIAILHLQQESIHALLLLFN